MTVKGCFLQGLGEQEALSAEGPGQGQFHARHAQLCRLHTAPSPASPPLPSTRVPAARRRESGSGACLDLQVIDTVRSGRDREDTAMHHLLCGGLYKPRRRVRAGRTSES